MSYYKAFYPDKELNVTANDVVCSNCYFLGRNLAKCSQSVDPNSDLNSIINKYKESFYKNKMNLAVKKVLYLLLKSFSIMRLYCSLKFLIYICHLQHQILTIQMQMILAILIKMTLTALTQITLIILT